MQKYNLFENLQSAYRKFHSTETALLKIQNDVFCSLDEGGMVLLVLLDLSAAFDTIDHQLLINRLQSKLGLSGVVLKWFESYLSHRQQRIIVKNSCSSNQKLEWGVPQGSVLGPLLFSIYLLPLGELIRRNNLSFHMYADDVQLYLTFQPNKVSSSTASESVQHCIQEIHSWMNSNKLKLNGNKTEFITLGRKCHLTNNTISHLCIGDSPIECSTHIRNLGIYLDQELNMQSHVSSVCKTAYFHLRNIARIRKYLSEAATQSLIHAFITSRIDYGNSLLWGIPKLLQQRLQHVQNSAARLVKRKKKSDHISPVLYDLHWLPIAQRIKFKLLLITYKALQNMAPGYISDLISTYQPARSLRSADASLLNVPYSRLATCGDRAFSVAAPKLWNSLPLQLRNSTSLTSFKSGLKTFLFKEAFP